MAKTSDGPGQRWHLPAEPSTLSRQFLPVLTTTLARLLWYTSLQRRSRVYCYAVSRDARLALTLSQNERQLLRSQASRKEKRPRTTSTQPLSLREVI